MRRIFEFLTIFDWITPTIGFAEDIINDQTLLQSNSWTFFVPYDQSLNAGWNAVGIHKMLHHNGIQWWGAQYDFPTGKYFFSVRVEQAQWAEYLLLCHGIPLEEKFIGAPAPPPIEGEWTVVDPPTLESGIAAGTMPALPRPARRELQATGGILRAIWNWDGSLGELFTKKKGTG